VSPPVRPIPYASEATNSAFLISGIGGTLIQTILAPRACASSAGCVNKGGATLTTTSTSGLVSSSARNICAWRCGSNVVGPVTRTLTLPPRSFAAALAPARISVLHSPAASASTTETVTESLAAAMPGAPVSAAAAKPLNKADRENPSTRAFSPFAFMFSPPLTHHHVVCSSVSRDLPPSPDDRFEATGHRLPSRRAPALRDAVKHDRTYDHDAGDEFRIVQIDVVEDETAVDRG